MPISKDEILEKAQVHKAEKNIFKQKLGFSLTPFGFEFVKTIYPEYYMLRIEDIKPKDFIMMQKVLKTPYYINNTNHTLYHYDELLDTQSVFYKNNIRMLFEQFL